MIWMMMALACAPKTQNVVENGPTPSPIPVVGDAREFTPKQPEETLLNSGARLWHLQDTGLPVVSIRVILPGGAASDGSAWGTADIAAQMLRESAGERSAQELAGELRLQANQLWASAGRRTTELGFSGHVNRLEEGLPLLADVIYRPTFSEADWDRVIDQQIQSYRQMLDDGKSLMGAFDQYFLYGSDHPLGTPAMGVPDTLTALDREAVKAWHLSRLVADEVGIVVVGDLTVDEAKNLLDTHLPSWPGESYAAPAVPQLDALPGDGGVILLDLPGSEQTGIRVLSRAWAPGDEVAAAAEMAGVVLGGSFTSRLNNLLRETKGYTYGAGCRFVDGVYGGIFYASTSVRTDATTPALLDLNGVLVDAVQGFTQEEWGKARSQLRNDAMDTHASRGAMAGALSTAMGMGRNADALQLDLARSQSVTLEQMNAAAPLAIPERGLMMLVGDESVIGPELEQAGIGYELVTVPQ